ncbi:MAG TPA: metal ABC transporter permease [Candidatus Pacearchaeota archaeon]|nr:metal ABC transporter permease [Candidatus Pacearchaeota archaeon]HOL90623.1 metal ABC transporter permease [Candidatus Pacearchaeota archaeon]HPO68652.1 metal ABC transporter permease [Candidatus Pacearchaeota archaeon]
MDFQFLYILITGILIGGVAGYLGTLTISKRMALSIDPLGHLALPGVALGLLYGLDISLCAFLFIILGMILIWYFEIKTKLPTETLTAIVFTLGVAITFLFFPLDHDELEQAFIGDISKVNFSDVLFTLFLSLLLFFIVKKIYQKIILINISEDLAKIEKINIKKYNFLYLLSIAIIVALGTKIVGGLLSAALVAIPAATSRNLSKNLSQFSFLSVLFGILSALIGIFLFKITGIQAGPLIILSSVFFFFISLFKLN